MSETPASESELESRLDAISTRQTLLRLAHQEGSDAASARNQLVLRYRRAIRAYLVALLNDEEAADEVAHRVVLNMLQGAFAGADSTRSRFRHYLKRSVRNAALAFWRERNRSPAVDPRVWEQAATPDPADQALDASFRRSLLEAAFARLEAQEQAQAGNAFATVIRLAIEYPEYDSFQLAEEVSRRIGRPIRPDAVRQQLSRGRRRLAELLWLEACQTISDATVEQVTEELTELGLMDLIRDYLPDETVA